jgi:signal transduction histidine kinase
MRLLPRTLFGQILLALLVGLLAAQAVGAWLMLDDRVRLAGRLLGGYAAQRIAGIVSLLDEADVNERARLVRALSVPPTRISLDEPWRTPARAVSDDATVFASFLERELARPHEMQVLSIMLARPGRSPEERERLRQAQEGNGVAPRAGESQRDASGEPARPHLKRVGRVPLLLVIAQVKLADGAIATFRHALPQAPADRPLRVIGLIVVTGITVALLAGWTVRRLTRPLATLADAATGLATNLDRPPLPEAGPMEVSRAARAFNTMQRELKAYLETRSQALAGVSHDLRLPITRARLRLERVTDPAVKRSIESDLDEMERMIASTLDFLRAGTSGETPIRLNLNALIEGVADDMEALGAQVNVQGRCDAPLVARPQALRRCLGNLMDNARQYGGGAIDVRVLDSAERVEIRIEDRGPGIPEADRERVFEPYVRLDPSRAKHTGGTGLGLAIARAIARAHGGDVTLADRAGGGLSVRLVLPR